MKTGRWLVAAMVLLGCVDTEAAEACAKEQRERERFCRDSATRVEQISHVECHPQARVEYRGGVILCLCPREEKK